MKDKAKILLLAITLVLGLITIIIKSNITQHDNKKFKLEYELLNDKDNGYNNKHLKISINENNKIKYATYEEVKKILTEDSGVIYFGFPECPWCRNIIEPLLNAADETEIKNIYYFNAKEIRDIKHLDENNQIITDKEGTQEYNELIKIMYDYLGEYEGLNDQSIKRLYFPSVVFVKEGKIIDIHIGTLEEQENPYEPLNTNQIEKLKNIYKSNILKTIDTKCSDKC